MRGLRGEGLWLVLAQGGLCGEGCDCRWAGRLRRFRRGETTFWTGRRRPLYLLDRSLYRPLNRSTVNPGVEQLLCEVRL